MGLGIRYWVVSFVLLALAACGGSGGSNLIDRPGDQNNTGDDDTFADIQPYDSSANYADELYDCVLAQTYSQLCSLNTLPLLGMEVANPTVDDVMGRVLVSHDWMAERFRELLEAYPVEFLTLFKGLTAVVIDDDVRPAYYSSGTGAIYIDPAYLWVSVAEKQTINPKEDYRSGFDDLLAFKAFNRFLTPQGDYAASWGSLTDAYPRNLSDASFFTARLLLHELAHVNDFLPYDSYSTFDRNDTVVEAVDSLSTGLISDQLIDWWPLISTIWDDLGEVMFHGDAASSAQQELTAQQVGAEFEADAAADDYAYSSQYEDLAMLFEIAMMKYFFNMDFEQAFVTPVGSEARYCNDFTIGWGAKGWIGDADVKERAEFVTSALLPDLDLSEFYANLPAPEIMTAYDWCLPSSFSAGLGKPGQPQLVPVHDYGYPH